MKYVCPQISRSSNISGNRWSVPRVEWFLPGFLLRILTCVPDPLSGWNSTRKPSSVSRCLFIQFEPLLHYYYIFLRDSCRRVFSPNIFDICLAQFFNLPYFLGCSPNVWNLTNSFFLLLESFTSSYRTPPYVGTYLQLFPNFGHKVKNIFGYEWA